jgi:hypothetical protein
LQLLKTTVTIEHLNPASTVISNDGNKGFTWRVCFQGPGKQALVNGKPSKLRLKTRQERQQSISYLDIYVKPGAQIKVELQ